MRLRAFDNFRGIAILLVVAGHSFGGWAIGSFGEKIVANLITGATGLFVFISGFFFHHVYYANFRYGTFLRTKAKNVLSPYVILSMVAILCYLISKTPLPLVDVVNDRFGFNTRLSSWYEYIRIIAVYLWMGRINLAYWYVPFIFIMFLLSPAFVAYIKLPALARTYLLCGLLAASTLIQRPEGNLSPLTPLHSVLYFTPFYMLGIVCSIHRERVTEILKDKALLLGAVVLMFAAAQAFFYGRGNISKAEIFSYNGIDIIVFQKVFMCFFFLSVLSRYEDRNIPGLKLLATTSFAIYFLHPWMMLALDASGYYAATDPVPGPFVVLLTLPLLLLSSLLVAYLAKLLLKKNSRYIIGW